MIAVTGATGNVGSALVRALVEAGEETAATSRRTGHDLTNPETLRPALEGSEALFLLGMPGEPDELLDVARTSGVRRIVLLSAQAARTRPQLASHEPFRRFEPAVRESRLMWTVLRPGGFHSSAFQWAEQVRTRRALRAPFGAVAIPIVDPADLAAVAAVVLRSDDHGGRTYELTGPAAVSPREQARAIADAIGEPVGFTELTREEARVRMLEFMPAPIADGTLDILGDPTPDERRVSPDVERILHRVPNTFARWAARNADAFR